MTYQSNFQKLKRLIYFATPRFLLRPALSFINIYIKRVFWSQSNEADLIRSIVKIDNESNIPIEFIEFGFGPTEFNCISLSQKGENGLIFDQNKENVNLAKKLLHKNTKIYWKKMIPDDLKSIRNSGVYNIISIDVDGIDYEFAEVAFKFNRPNLLIVEYNSTFGDKNIKVPFDISFNRHEYHSYYHGASIVALLNLAHSNNYCLYAVSENAVNAFFIPSLKTKRQKCLGNLAYALNLNSHGIRSKKSMLSISEQFKKVENLPLVNLDNTVSYCPALNE
jgi:hypothetical protein